MQKKTNSGFNVAPRRSCCTAGNHCPSKTLSSGRTKERELLWRRSAAAPAVPRPQTTTQEGSNPDPDPPHGVQPSGDHRAAEHLSGAAVPSERRRETPLLEGLIGMSLGTCARLVW